MVTEQNNQLYKNILATYAANASLTKGRRYKEEPHPFRTVYQRDIARIIHSRPFRRLEYKTQVFLNGTGDHFRTRLTHTIEVATTAKTIARALNLNEDLTEAIAMGHDLGHAPFGHVGEQTLNKLLSKYNLNFEHNCHSLRIVDKLIKKYPAFPGLNLTWETRLGLLKHRATGQKLDNFDIPKHLSLEAQTADIADNLTYYGHDIDDGLVSNLVSLKDLNNLKIWQTITTFLEKKGINQSSEMFIPYSIRTLIDYMVTDVISYSKLLLNRNKIINPQTPQNRGSIIITFSPKLITETKELKEFLYSNLYQNEKLNNINKKCKTIIKDLFNHYMQHPEAMHKTDAIKSKTNLYTIISDYIAGMTDRFALNEHDKINIY
jgi:dGTPase